MTEPGGRLQTPVCLSGMRILIAEDRWELADNMAVLLEEKGARILGPFASATKAMDCVRSEKIHFALVDMNLSDNFADDLMMELAHRAIPCAIVTGFGALPSDAMSHAVEIFLKPVKMPMVIELIRKYRN